MSKEYQLYSYFRSSCSARLRFALNLKRLSYNLHTVNLLKGEHLEDGFAQLNPSQSVPVLCVPGDSTFTITQSMAALEYLEEKHPECRPLLPPLSDSALRAEVRVLANIICCDNQPVTNMRILNRVDALGGDRGEWARGLIEHSIRAYEAVASQVAGKYSVRDEISLADVCLLPAIWNAQRYGVDISPFPTVFRVARNLEMEPAAAAAHWQNQPDTPEWLKNPGS